MIDETGLRPENAPAPMDELMDLAVRVTEARRRLGLSQSALARRAGITPAAVWQIENGQRQPAADTLRRLAPALHSTADWLLGIDGADRVPELGRLLDRLETDLAALREYSTRKLDRP